MKNLAKFVEEQKNQRAEKIKMKLESKHLMYN